MAAANNLNWYWFKGKEVSSGLLRDLCLFRSHILFDSGNRKNFGFLGKNFGDIQFSDFESFHIVVCERNKIIGTIRVTPPLTENVTLSVLGLEGYKKLAENLMSNFSQIIEVNRLMLDPIYRGTNVSQLLMYASIGLIEALWISSKMTLIASAGNNRKQSVFISRYTDFQPIEGYENFESPQFGDTVTLLKCSSPPYKKGSNEIESFKTQFQKQESFLWKNFESNFQMNPKLEFEAAL